MSTTAATSVTSPPPALATALQQAQATYIADNPKSLAQHQKAAQVLPGGNTRTVIFAHPFPITLVHSEGCRVTSLDGRDYIDFLGEYTAGIYGHSHPLLRQAVLDTLEHGWVVGGHIPQEEALARLICTRFPSIEQVRFTNSGTEANLVALTLARAFTERKKVVVFEGGYHGGVFTFANKASPMIAPFDFIVCPYNDLEGTQRLIDVHAQDIACILVEPMQGSSGCIPADPQFLQGLRAWASAHQALLIFDEVMTSRLAAGGRQSLIGVTPDMTTLGKYIGGGFSFGAFGGRADIMERFNPLNPNALPHAGTFNNNVFSMSVGLVGLRDIYTAEAAQALNARGDALRTRINAIAASAGFPMQCTGLGSLMNVHMATGEIRNVADLSQRNTDLSALFYFDMVRAGVWIAQRGMINVSLPMGDAECDHLITAVERFVQARGAL